VSSLSDGVVHSDLTTIKLNTIQCFSGLGGILNVLEVEEGKASATPTVAIQHNIHPLQGAELLKFLLQLPLRSVQAQTEHPQAFAWLGSITVTIMAPAVGHGGP